VGNRANPDPAKQASRACVVGPNCLTTSRAALALQASQPQVGVRSCLTSSLSIDEPHMKFRCKSFCTFSQQQLLWLSARRR
jgi:hypothetical protein